MTISKPFHLKILSTFLKNYLPKNEFIANKKTNMILMPRRIDIENDSKIPQSLFMLFVCDYWGCKVIEL